MANHHKLSPSLDPRLIALETINLVVEKGAYANIAIEKVLRRSSLSSEDRHLVTEIVYGTVRMLKHLDWVLNLFLHQPVAKQNPWLRNILRLSLYQMLFMERIPDYAVVNHAVELCRKKCGSKLASVVNGVLRNIGRNRDNLKYPDANDGVSYLAVLYSQPEWLINKLVQDFDRNTLVEMLKYFNQRPVLVLRTNQLKVSRRELVTVLTGEGVQCQISELTPWSIRVERLDRSLADLESYQSGLFYVQNEASMLAVSILDPRPGENLADLACGVGGKTTFMAEKMSNTGHIDAYDLYDHKLKILVENCRRLGISIVTGHQKDISSRGINQATYDGVFLDAPCSGLGVLNRRADARWKKQPDSLAELTDLQTELLAAAGAMVAPGGKLVYCTCTINPDENQAVINQFLHNHPDFSLEGFSQAISYFPLDEQDTEQAREGMLTILPGKYDTDGMFYAKMRKVGVLGNEFNQTKN